MLLLHAPLVSIHPYSVRFRQTKPHVYGVHNKPHIIKRQRMVAVGQKNMKFEDNVGYARIQRKFIGREEKTGAEREEQRAGRQD